MVRFLNAQELSESRRTRITRKEEIFGQDGTFCENDLGCARVYLATSEERSRPGARSYSLYSRSGRAIAKPDI